MQNFVKELKEKDLKTLDGNFNLFKKNINYQDI